MPLPWQTPFSRSIVDPRSLPNLALWLDSKDVSSLRNNAGSQPANSDGIKLAGDKSGNSGVNVLCLLNAIGNYGSAPDSVPLSITGPIDLRADIEANSYATVGNQNIISKTQTDGQSAYDCYIGGGGSSLVFRYTPTGTFAALRTATSTATLGSVAAVFTRVQVRVTYDSASGDVIFYYRTDRDISASTGWTQLGATVTLTAGTIFDGTNVLTVGGWTGGNAGFSGLIYRAQIYNGIAGTLAFDANFATASKLATSFTESSSNAATVTINTSGATGARISGARDLYQGTAANQPILTIAASGNYLTFDGSNDYLKAAAFSLSQPETVYFVGSQVTWTLNDNVFSGNATGSAVILYQRSTTPTVTLFAGANGPDATTWATSTNAVITAVANNTASLLRVNRGTATTGTSSTQGSNGFTLGAAFDGSTPANITASEVLIYAAAHDKATQERVLSYLARKWGVAL